MAMLLVGSILCIAFYLYVYYAAEQPKLGTLEWISMEEVPQYTRTGFLHRLQWLDILWCFLSMVFAGFCRCLLVTKLSFGSFSLLLTPLLLSFPNILLQFVVPLLVSALLIYVLCKLLTGKVLPSILAVLLIACTVPLNDGSNSTMTGAFLLASFLYLHLWLHHNGVLRWFSLALSAVFLAACIVFHPGTALFVIPWILSLLFCELLVEDDRRPRRVILTLCIGIAVFVGSVIVYHIPLLPAPSISAFFQALGLRFLLAAYLFFSDLGQISFVLNLPALSLILAGCIFLIHSTHKRHDLKAVMLILWSLAVLVFDCVLPLNLLYPIASIVLAYFVHRISARQYPAAAVCVGFVPFLITAITTLLTIWEV